MSNVSTASPTQTIAGDDISIINTEISRATQRNDDDDDITLVSTIDYPSRPVNEIHWSPSPFFNIPNVNRAGNFEADLASNHAVPQGETERDLFTKFFDFLILKIRSLVERLVRPFLTAWI